jgi:hypothetical protein
MNYLPRALALFALAGLFLCADMAMTGWRLDGQRFMTRSIGVTHIPPESAYVQSVYDQQVGTDAEAVMKAAEILNHAGLVEQSRLLQRYFSYCNVQRFLGESSTCGTLTVRAAMDRAAGLSPDAQWSVEKPLESQLAEALSFSLATESLLRTSVADRNWSRLSYEGPGILHYDTQSHGAYLFLAVRNHTPWEITGARIHLQLHLPVEIQCNTNLPFPFFRPTASGPETETLAYCDPRDAVSLENLLAAVREAQHEDHLMVWVEEFTLQDPSVRVVENGSRPAHLFTVSLTGNPSSLSHQAPGQSVGEQVSREISGLSCSQTANCPAAFESASLALFDFLNKNVPLPGIPIIVGLLLGVGIGGLFRRSFLVVGVLFAMVLAGVIGTAAFEFHGINSRGGEKGFALMGMGVLLYGSAIGFVLLVPATLVGAALMKPLWKPAKAVSLPQD